ncbi:hypothetical protein JKA74_20390 [Marivirga sp. S37H4]|uniref:Uncharacterized protein n=1 Tax=Marivirga aurantiaca TaxID=2802615 RepID=A0A934X2U3_9BACT|nr:hypothetical protein [Marivirga aurantiaca]MBK6267412.1 hypothetical protein [Marivirga aurantiaca]
MKIENKTTFLAIPVLAIFLCYWLVTIFYNLPDNYIKLQHLEGEKVFNSVLFQKWSFFAPPPKHNDRLYYAFHSIDSEDTIVLEAAKPIVNSKREKAPFNAKYEVIDYILNNSMIQINDFLVDQRKSIKFQFPDSSEDKFIRPLMEFTWDNREYLKAVQTLANYGEIVAVRNNIDLTRYKYRFYIVNESIPPFSERGNIKDIERKQSKIFESPLI